MTTYLVVKFRDSTRANEVVPGSWFRNGECALPLKNIHRAAEECTVLKTAWRRHACTIVSTHDSYQKALKRKEEMDTSESTEAFISSCGKNLRSEGSKRIQRQKDAVAQRPSIQLSLPTLHFVSPDEDDIEQDVVETVELSCPVLSKGLIANVSFAGESDDSMLEDIAITKTFNDGPVTRPKVAHSPCQAITFPRTSQEIYQPRTRKPPRVSPERRTSFEKYVIRMLKNQNRYLRVMAREVAEVKSEQKELRKLLLRRTSMAEVNNNTEDIGLPAFQKHVALPLQSVEDFKYFEEELLKEDVRKNLVYMLRSFFERNLDDTVRRIWREVMSYYLMKLYTWSGTPKPNSGKEKGLAVKGSRLLLAVIEAVKHGEFEGTTIPKIENITQIFIRKAVDRLKTKR
ncbi:hypothetical protein OUZ56_033432 [Daphnia magna]|uniref:DUF4806 domain-containing protein n=2 Tax=Daphnia magna TaxID=35525 RepID=A0ABR0BAQ8_9CRUS|nr:hypothetical protein OUZ56_033432 [Daphnia magna]